MSLELDTIARKLERSAGIDEWLIHERETTTTVREFGGSDLRAQKHSHVFDVVVLRDQRSARGEARFSLFRNAEGDLDSRLTAAAAQASKNTGPLWRLPRPAAPARVQVSDQRLMSDPMGVIAELATTLESPDRGARVTSATLRVRATQHRVRLSTKFEHEYRDTRVEASGTLAIGNASVRSTTAFSRARRRATDLDLRALLANKAETLRLSVGAQPLIAGDYDLVLAQSALRRSEDIDSWLAPLAAQARGRLALRGLARYQPGQMVFGTDGGDPINIGSDGTIDYANESAPIDDWGGPIRRFRLIENGRASALALTSREAALSDRDGNGGPRNLVLGTGVRSLDELTDGERPRLLVTSLDSLRANTSTGELTGQIQLATLPDSNKAVSGGHFAFELFSSLGRIRLSSESDLDPLGGPAWIAIPNVRVI